MDSFEELGVAPELVEALAAEGVERPTPLQEAVIPLLRKGNNAVLAAGPGSGLLVAWATGILERVAPEGDGPRVLVLTATRDAADRVAESVARLAAPLGHTVAALGSAWVMPERAHVVVGSPDAVLRAVAADRLSLSAVVALVIDQAPAIEALGDLEDVERVLDYVPAEAQRVLTALPATEATHDLVRRHLKRAVTLPAPVEPDVPRRGTVRFRIVSEPRESATLDLVSELLAEDARHVLVFCRSEDRAADVGDHLTLHGFVAGPPGDASVPVWLGVDALEARGAARGMDGVAVVSCDAPTDPDELDRRHSIAPDGVVVVLAREVPHLRDLGKRTGYATVPFPPPPPAPDDAVGALRRTLERALAEEDTAPYLAALEPLFERHDPAEVAAAAVALLRRKAPPPAATEPAAGAERERRGEPAPGPAWVKLFVGVGERDGLRPGDLVGAITGEAGVPGDAVGRIDIKESHSVVEVHEAVARKVIRAINGTTIKGRAVRADFDRPRKPQRPRGRR